MPTESAEEEEKQACISRSVVEETGKEEPCMGENQEGMVPGRAREEGISNKGMLNVATYKVK